MYFPIKKIKKKKEFKLSNILCSVSKNFVSIMPHNLFVLQIITLNIIYLFVR